ncbi:MAG TPA: SAM-dependent chlorinase/fluorinase [Pyrinomonadaceae bacterium]|jgi:hypothetical protein
MLATLLTDFGTADYFVGAMKGALLRVCSRAQIIDITHEIPPHDIEAGAFALLAAYETFPSGTVHVAVVDPGVGSARRPILVATREHLFVGPDNGLFGYVYSREREFGVYHLTNEKYFRHNVDATFHGRDLFAPVAGALLNGVEPRELGERIENFVQLARPTPQRAADGTLHASIIHIDRFGNCITNISRSDLTNDNIARGARIVVGEHEVRSFRRFFADETDAPGEPFALWGSAGLLEIAVFRDSAARRLGIARGQTVKVVLDVES